MVAMIFEYWFDPDAPEIYEEYERASEAVRRQLAGVAGFHGVERFQSSAEPDKFVTIGFFSNEEAVERWRNHPGHRRIQALGRNRLFVRYRVRMAGVTATTAATIASRRRATAALGMRATSKAAERVRRRVPDAQPALVNSPGWVEPWATLG